MFDSFKTFKPMNRDPRTTLPKQLFDLDYRAPLWLPGGHLQTIFGVSGERWINHPNWPQRYINEWWTRLPPEYRPDADRLPDDGAYW